MDFSAVVNLLKNCKNVTLGRLADKIIDEHGALRNSFFEKRYRKPSCGNFRTGGPRLANVAMKVARSALHLPLAL